MKAIASQKAHSVRVEQSCQLHACANDLSRRWVFVFLLTAVLAVTSELASGSPQTNVRFDCLYSFGVMTNGGNPGALVQGADGYFYGTTSGGGTNGGYGTVFKISATGDYSDLYAFTGRADGEGPSALVQGSDGYLYGTTQSGGTNGGGTIFKISTAGTFTTIYSLGPYDGTHPSGLVQGSDGNFYGTTPSATVFKISPVGKFTTLHYFNPGGGNFGQPSRLVQGKDGYFYGTTSAGGTNNDGTVFKISASGAFTICYSFSGGNDGATPYAGLVQGSDGYLYGTASSGGSNGVGTIFKISTAGAFTNLYSFKGGYSGAGPAASLVQGVDGYLYGTTQNAGTNRAGTVFKISTAGAFTALYSFASSPYGSSYPSSLAQGTDGYFYGAADGPAPANGMVFKISSTGSLTSIYSFPASADGVDPSGALVLDTDGYFYGTTAYGGTNAGGTIFRVSAAGAYTSLYSFPIGSYGSDYPASLAQGKDGYLYGTTEAGGPRLDGTVFKFDGGGLTSLYSFIGDKDGGGPIAALMQGSDGWFYGTAEEFGEYNDGTVFKMDASGTLSTLYSFTGGLGLQPSALVQDASGSWYGTTRRGGPYMAGTVFKVSPNGTLTTIYSFTDNADGGTPSGLAQGADGYLYGTTYGGGANGLGTIFRISSSGTLTSIYSFASGENAQQGTLPSALVQANDGYLYGTTVMIAFKISPTGMFTNLHSFNGETAGMKPSALALGSDGALYGTASGGTYGSGMVFRMGTNGVFANLYSFSGSNDGAGPTAALVNGGNGYFYGSTQYGGANGDGTIFKVSPNGALTTLYSFSGGSNGANPTTALALGGDGSFYGTTENGGTNSEGTVFKVTPNGTFATLYSFACGDGGHPSSLVEGSDGNFYGTTAAAVFKLTASGALTDLYFFAGGDDGANPRSPLVAGSDGFLYGTTPGGGINGNGTIFRMGADGALRTLYCFTNGSDGASPFASLVQSSDGFLYGTAPFGGKYGYGTVFRVTTNGTLTSLYAFTGGSDGAYPVAALVQGTNGQFYGTTLGMNPYGGSSQSYGTIFQISSNGAFTNLYSFTGGGDGCFPMATLTRSSDGAFYGLASSGGAGGHGTVFRLTVGDSVPVFPTIITDNTAFGFSNGVFGFDVSGPAGSQATIQVSADLRTWISVQTNLLGLTPVYFSDPQSRTNVRLFYRAVLP